MQKLKGNTIMIGLLLLELFILILAAGFSCFHARKDEPLTWNKENLFLVQGRENNENGYEIDESFSYQGCFTCGPYRPLSKGIYTVTVFYNTDTDENTAYAFSETAEYFVGSLKSDKAVLKAGMNSKTFKIWINRNFEDFEIRTDYNGSGFLEIHQIVVEKSKSTYSYLLLRIFFFLMICNVLLFLWKQKKKKDCFPEKWKIGFGLTLIILFAAYPLFYDFLIYGTDLRFHLMRIDGIRDAIKMGQIPVKIVPGWLYGYGYAISVFYGSLFLYIPAVFRILGMTLQDSYKIYCLLVIIGTCFSSYYCFKKIFQDHWIGLFGSMLYTLSAYHISILYSGWTGAFSASVFLPVVLYGMYAVFTIDSLGKNNRTSFLPLVIGLTGIIQSHILTCEMVAAFIVITCICLIRKVLKKEVFWELFKAAVITFFLNAWFLIPFLDYMGGNFNITSDRTSTMFNIQRNGIQLANFFTFFQNRVRDRRIASYGIGPVLLFGVILYLYLCFFEKQKKDQQSRFVTACFGLGILACFFTTVKFPWDTLAQYMGSFSSLVFNLEYPWRFLPFAILFLSVVLCGVVSHLSREKKTVWRNMVCLASVVLVLLSLNQEISTILSQSNNFQAYDTEAMDRYDYKTGWGIREYLPIGTEIGKLNTDLPVLDEEIELLAYQKKGIRTEVSCVSQSEKIRYIELPLLYYRGYTALDPIAKQELEITGGNNNVIRVLIPPKYNGSFVVDFKPVWYWKLSYGVSAGTFILLMGWLLFKRKGMEKQYEL